MSAAIALALTEPRGPVHLDLPEDVAVAPATGSAAGTGRCQPRPPGTRNRPCAELIAAAKRPVAVIGASAMRIADPGLLRRVIERHGLPFATTTMAKGMISEEHPLAIGCIERACRQVQRRLLRTADLIVGIGYDTVEVEYETWIGDVPLLHIDIEPADIAAGVMLVHQVTGDLGAALARLAALPSPERMDPGRARRPSPCVRRRAAAGQFGVCVRRSTRFAMRCRRMESCRSMSAPIPIRSRAKWTPGPKTFHITNGWSSMGFGLPVQSRRSSRVRPAGGVPDRRRLLQMTCGEVAVAKRLGLTLPVVVLDDKWLALIKVKQIRRQFPLYGTELQQEDYREPPAHYFGVPAHGVRSAAALATAVTAALAADGPTVIEAVVDSDHYVDTVYD